MGGRVVLRMSSVAYPVRCLAGALSFAPAASLRHDGFLPADSLRSRWKIGRAKTDLADQRRAVDAIGTQNGAEPPAPRRHQPDRDNAADAWAGFQARGTWTAPVAFAGSFRRSKLQAGDGKCCFGYPPGEWVGCRRQVTFFGGRDARCLLGVGPKAGVRERIRYLGRYGRGVRLPRERWRRTRRMAGGSPSWQGAVWGWGGPASSYRSAFADADTDASFEREAEGKTPRPSLVTCCHSYSKEICIKGY